jgi:hypothetical protein
MNMPDNIYKLGNYRYRSQEQGSQFLSLINTFDNADAGNFYTGATDADVVIDGGFENNGTPQAFISKKEKLKLLYSLEDCVKPFRPRSGINKATFFNGKYLSNSGYHSSLDQGFDSQPISVLLHQHIHKNHMTFQQFR